MSATFTIILDVRRIKKNNKYPVKLRVTFNRQIEYYQTIFDLSEDEYRKLPSSRIKGELQTIKNKLKEIERGADYSIKDLEPFTFMDFEKDYIQDNSLFKKRKLRTETALENVYPFDYFPFHKKFPILLEEFNDSAIIGHCYLTVIKRLLREGRIGTAVNYHGSYVAIKRFRGHVRFSEITPSFLNEFENSLKSRDVSRSTVGMYVRPLRAIFNEAIEDGVIKREKCYPFGKRKYRIPTSKNVKKSLTISDVKKIYYYESDVEMESEKKAKDYWLFSYFGNGMNPKDIACLKYKNIHDDYLVFERSKTEKVMRSDPRPITIFINEDMNAIIERWGNKDKNPNNYIFPLFEPGMSPLRQYEIMQLFVHFINDWMKIILKKLGIEKKATTYVARHTFSTILKRAGASTEYIQEALGHTDVKTTETYLDSFDNEMKKEFSHRLSAFKVGSQLQNTESTND